MKHRWFSRLWPPLAALALILILWELLVSATHISNHILPAPGAVAAALFEYRDILAVHTLQTLLEAVLGLGIAVALGVAAALVLDTSALVRRAIYPVLVTSQTVPMIALAPLLLIWLGFDLRPKVIIVVLYCFFPVAIAMARGLADVDPEQINLFRSMGASYRQTLKMLKIPAALPAFFSGLKIAVTYSMTAAIVGEYVGAYTGLGIFIQTSANAHAVPLVFAAIIITSAVSLALFGLVGLAERLVVPWHHSR